MSTELVKSNKAVAFNYFDSDQFATMQRLCTMFANSELVPEMYRITDKNQKEKAIANCMIAIETAQRIGASPLMVMQNMYIVYGKPSWSAKFLTATVNACGRFKSIKYRWANLGNIKAGGQDIENWECVAYTSERDSDEILESIPVSMQMAINEGWYDKKGSKWKTMPKLMLQYRTVTYWTSAYAPELSMGIKTAEELHDIEDIEYVDISDKVKAEVRENANKEEIGMDEPENKPEPKSNTEQKPEPKEEKKGPNF